MFKIDRKRKIMAAVFSSALIFSNVSLARENKVDAYIENQELNICDYGQYEIKLNEEEIDKLIEEGQSLLIEFGDNRVEIDSDELLKIKKESSKMQSELNCYKTVIYTVFGAIILCIIKSKMKKEVYTKVK